MITLRPRGRRRRLAAQALAKVARAGKRIWVDPEKLNHVVVEAALQSASEDASR